MKKSNGPFRSFIDRYLQLRRSLGALLKNAEYTLNNFDLYLARNFPRAKKVTKPMIVGYLHASKVQAATVYNRFVELRQFCRFLFQLNPYNYVPGPRLFREGPTVRLPHIYTPEEVTKLIRLARARTCVPKGSLRPHTFGTLLSLLWVAGLRIREALRLNLEDVDTDNAVLHIRESKFFKSRLVPVASSTATALETYKMLRAEHGYDQSPGAPFFVNDRARRCSHSLVSQEFRALVRQSGMKTVQGRYPRLHDFRHTFATRYLHEVYKKGKNPGASLPLLATYLGHVNISHTQVYLHPSSGLLADVGQKFYEHVHKSDNQTRGGKGEDI